jgi:plastocyanin
MNRVFVTTAILAVLLTATIPFAQTISSVVAQEEPGHLVTVAATDESGEELTGMWISISLGSGVYFGSGYTPLTFPGESGDTYIVMMSDYDGITFDQWEDGSTERTRTITLADDTDMTVLTAQYDTGPSMRGVTPITYEDGGPSLTVEAMQGDEMLNIWTILDPQPNGDDSATFTVYAGNYQHYIFDSWSDGNTDRIRTLTIVEDTTITAQYKQAESVIVIPFGAFDPTNPAYEPVELSVARGETVLVHNVDVAPHSVTSGTGPEDPTAAQAFETGLLFQDEYAHIETDNLDEGEYEYYCFVHPYMQGRLIVTG